MTDAEAQLLQNLFSAAWSLPTQVAAGALQVIGYFVWSRTYHRRVDPALRDWAGRCLGAPVVWVRRHTHEYDTPFELAFLGMNRYARWTWGIQNPARRTFLRDATAYALGVLCVNGIAGTWPVAALLYLALSVHALSYVVFFPACVLNIALYSVFFSGLHEVDGMRS